MNLPQPQALHAQLLTRADTLLVVRQPVAPPRPAPGQPGTATDYVQSTPEIFVAVLADEDAPQGWRTLAFNGHVDLGTGIRTALAQIVAEELEVPLDRLDMVLGHTAAAPNQGPTIASASIQISAVPLRRAAAQAREQLLALAARQWNVAADHLQAREGLVRFADGSDARQLDYGELLRGQQLQLQLAPSEQDVKLKPASDYRLVGRGAARVDIPAKATGELSFVHDVRVPGMRHGRVIRPPHPGRDGGDFIGRCLVTVNHDSVAHLPGNVQVVTEGDFVGVVADREEQAIAAMRALRVQWKAVPAAPDLSDLTSAIRANPAQQRALVDQGPVDDAFAGATTVLRRSYVWPYQMHASIGPSCAVADFSEGRLKLWAGTQNPHMLRTDLDRLLQLSEERIEIVRLEAAGCYGRNCADDVCADAALLSMAVGAPVRVQLTREQEHQWEPKGTAQLMDVSAAIDARGELQAYDFSVRYPSNDAPLLALLLTGRIPGQPRTLEMGDRTAVPPYRYASQRITCHDMAPIVRSSWLRGVSALPNSFAHDCMIDELAHAANADPVDYRVRNLDDTRAIELIEATAHHAGWQQNHTGSRGRPGADGMLHGRGVAYARYIHSRFPGFGAAWAAWVIDITVDPTSGRIAVQRLVVGQDTGMMVNPDGVRHQIHGNVIQTLSRSLMEKVAFNDHGVASREWGGYPIIGFRDLPPIEVVLMPRQEEPPMGAGESTSVPGPAALANALFDATGRRFYAAPFTPDAVRAVLHATPPCGQDRPA
ncbi:MULTISPECIES: molybdopterin cofactor-binding domain-containing protein [Comamonas]|uniref:xanthine dehydrogenase family protein molybdopterin-binding subunit n=1 Tax=Comamonas TaxID=283 RepID=UPI0001DA66C9|nr:MULTISPECIES: molybdopterin cofactor-binding domain-containing protein [Comamonas]EFI61531.1 aldehyde oxidase and xanthine dehydrogenase molybdopterin binding protein [Comamonas thiooxydans]TFF55869.1 xanthine dehydrogenase family protein molybdopterin-binding subunit [Comamonas sp. A23]